MSDTIQFILLFAGILLLGILLLTNNPGIAIKVANYVYVYLVILFVLRAVKNVQQK